MTSRESRTRTIELTISIAEPPYCDPRDVAEHALNGAFRRRSAALSQNWRDTQRSCDPEGMSGSNTRATSLRPPCGHLYPRELRPAGAGGQLSLIHISEPTRLLSISYAVFCLKKKK